ncbi:uncharacterized protein BCR38DRAFT_488936 [Pseudomassariella vexata]|uniref:Uncharacterized protein n=1 Tax=Pseudomassariella vexata TaxID=1141098 RepID=A0A1Y2DIZ7_9PEZI|nr:uncharacterized protein BCR38DRAFT_488936 [Pseudomassariella vexata]ORY59201.1 hypothetical protein BCR38DRAFT_488936 [Pseudomassariella vexata]
MFINTIITAYLIWAAAAAPLVIPPDEANILPIDDRPEVTHYTPRAIQLTTTPLFPRVIRNNPISVAKFKQKAKIDDIRDAQRIQHANQNALEDKEREDIAEARYRMNTATNKKEKLAAQKDKVHEQEELIELKAQGKYEKAELQRQKELAKWKLVKIKKAEREQSRAEREARLRGH